MQSIRFFHQPAVVVVETIAVCSSYREIIWPIVFLSPYVIGLGVIFAICMTSSEVEENNIDKMDFLMVAA